MSIVVLVVKAKWCAPKKNILPFWAWDWKKNMATQPWIALFYFVLPPSLGRAVSCQPFVTPGDQFPEAQQGVLEHLVTYRKFTVTVHPWIVTGTQPGKDRLQKHHVFRIYVKLRGLYCGPLWSMARVFSTFWGWQKIVEPQESLDPLNRKVWSCIAGVYWSTKWPPLMGQDSWGRKNVWSLNIYLFFLHMVRNGSMSSHIP